MIRKKQEFKPEILAPAGNIDSFFAAVAAGADSIYCSLKNFSARMEADNFSIEELSRLSVLAKNHGIKLYIAINSLLKDSEIDKVGRMVVRIKRYVRPDALIVNDPAMIEIAAEAGIRCELHLSTLSGFSVPSGLKTASRFGIKRVVLPREFNIDQIKLMAEQKSGVDLEAFIHGSLCYAVSGRCYWSSWLGGKSGLRGRCVQPCRRAYEHGKEKNSFFSCMDLGLDVLVKVLQEVKEVTTWKIEGRKKTPHYVYYTVWGYKSLRDIPMTAKEKKETVKIFDESLGRPLSHYNFLPQRTHNPAEDSAETGSGKFLGRVSRDQGRIFLQPRETLIKGDKLRVGYQGDSFHSIIYVPLSIPKGGKFVLRPGDFKKNPPSKTPVFLIDRKEKELADQINQLKKEYDDIEQVKTATVSFNIPDVKKVKPKRADKIINTSVKRSGANSKGLIRDGVWVDEAFIKRLDSDSKVFDRFAWFWLPPFIWPEKEQMYIDAVDKIIKRGGFNFIVNNLWYTGIFKNMKDLNVWGGPFCNLANYAAANIFKKAGLKGAIVSPELSGEDMLLMPEKSPLPLGVIIKGSFPFAVSAITPRGLEENDVFMSPKKEAGFVKEYDGLSWVYPGWELDLSDKRDQLRKAGYVFFAEMLEDIPSSITKTKRKKSKWNWDLKLL